ncbi:MAG: FHA domain-containing protein, partial [Microcoleaceae cyanobacterium]
MNSSSQPTIVAGNPYLEFNNHGQIIKIELTKEFHRLGRDRYRSDLIIPEDWLIISGCHATLRKLDNDDNTYCIYDGDGQRPSTNGLFIDNTRITTEEGYMFKAGDEIKIGLDPKTQIICKYVDPLQVISTINPPVIKTISLTNGKVLLGRDEQANFCLDSPLVSRLHASINLDKKGNYIIHDHSKNGLFVNNQRVENQTILRDGDRIKIGPFTLMKQGDCLELFDQGQQIRLDADRLFRKVKD